MRGAKMDPDTFLNCEKCDARRSDVRERGNGVTCARCGWNTETEPVVVIPDTSPACPNCLAACDSDRDGYSCPDFDGGRS